MARLEGWRRTLTADAVKAQVGDALLDGRRRAGGDQARAVAGPRAVLALQRNAGNVIV